MRFQALISDRRFNSRLHLSVTKLAMLGSFLLPLFWTSAVAVAQVQVESLNEPTEYRPTVGQPHPDFILPNIEDGQPLRLSDYRGKKVLLVHFASW